jgi:glutamate-1-semialdehyde aminotransferase
VASSHIAPTFVAGRGAHIWDTTGRGFIDWICGYGPIVLGHGEPRVAAAAFEQMLTGTLLPGCSELEAAVGQRLVRHFPHAEDYLFLKTGSEAVAAAIRLARAHTGRSQVLRIGFHGWHDGLIDPKIGWHNWDNIRTTGRDVVGVLRHPALGIEMDYGASLETVEARIRDKDVAPFAAVVLDPIQLSNPDTDLRQLRTACDDTGTLLILDETKTAFRVALGGVQELHGVAADITVAGKAMANGFPLSSVLGPANIVRAPGTRIKGTFSNERVALAAAKTTLDILEREDVCSQLAATGQQLIEQVNAALHDTPVADLVRAVPYRWNAMPHLHAATDDPTAQHCRHALIDDARSRGVLLLASHNSFVSAAHDHDDIERTAATLHTAAEALAPELLRSHQPKALTSGPNLPTPDGEHDTRTQGRTWQSS